MGFIRLLPLVLTILLILLLDKSHGVIPPLGRFLDPVNGAMAAAEPVDNDFSRKLNIKGLLQPVEINLEDRLVPHIRAQNNHDLYLAQGFIHAYFRLWQMDMQTRAAAGRVSEVAGKKAFKFDQGQRRKGMVYAAENSLRAMEADPRTKEMLDAYTTGINAYIQSLSYRDLPLEYKLMNFRPETWTNIRSALLLKYMADDLTGASDDITYTLLREQIGQEQFDFLFPEKIKNSKTVIPAGTKFAPPSLKPVPYPGDRVWSHFTQDAAQVRNGLENNLSNQAGTAALQEPSDEGMGIGSNNWAIDGKHSASGAPILCNDPHLGLNLPSLWFEMQLTSPDMNTYGASLPGAPGIIIGFNEHISWGFTNNYRDVKDFYEITANNRETYLFNGEQVPFQKRLEHIVIKDSVDVTDTVLYTIQGPVQYEPGFPDPQKTGKMLAMCWMAHRGTNELLSVYLINKAADYDQFTAAIQYFECPAQNFVYADKTGNIAMWGQGQFVNKWRGQGKFVMEGKDSLTLWGENIPMSENPHVLNPPQGYVASANQCITDTTYPYWYNGTCREFRSWRINQMLADFTAGSHHHPVTMDDCKAMQNDVTSLLKLACASLEKSATGFNGATDDAALNATSEDATQFQIWWWQLYKAIWRDDFPKSDRYPSEEITMQFLLSDTTLKYYDDKNTPQVETLKDLVQRAFNETNDSMNKLKNTASLEWYKVKNTSLMHLAKIPAFSYTQIKTGGWWNTINAMKNNQGPSWRMIVEMDKDIKAYGIYPGGQSGNPGSIHYSDNIDKWINGAYYDLNFVTRQSPKQTFKYKITLTPA